VCGESEGSGPGGLGLEQRDAFTGLVREKSQGA